VGERYWATSTRRKYPSQSTGYSNVRTHQAYLSSCRMCSARKTRSDIERAVANDTEKIIYESDVYVYSFIDTIDMPLWITRHTCRPT